MLLDWGTWRLGNDGGRRGDERGIVVLLSVCLLWWGWGVVVCCFGQCGLVGDLGEEWMKLGQERDIGETGRWK